MDKNKRMRGVVEAYHKSGMGPTKFASTNGLSLYQLKYWVKKFGSTKNEKPTSPGFIELKPTPAMAAYNLVEMEYPNGVKIKVPTGDLSFLSQLIKVY